MPRSPSQRIATRSNWLIRRVRGAIGLLKHLEARGYLTREEYKILSTKLFVVTRKIERHRDDTINAVSSKSKPNAMP